MKTHTATIWIAGDAAQAREACRDYCEAGRCVSVTPCEFIYTGGQETGVAIGLINYPKFPTDQATLTAAAKTLARLLLRRLHQRSCTVVTPQETYLIRRNEP